MSRLARRSGLLSDHSGWALALACWAAVTCWAAVACYPSAHEPHGIVMRWYQANTGTYRAGDEIVAVESGVEVGRWRWPARQDTYVVSSCAVAGCDQATCSLRHPCTIDSGPVEGIPVGLDGPAAVMGLPVAEGLAVDHPLHVVLPDGSHYGCDPRLACDLARCQSCGATR